MRVVDLNVLLYVVNCNTRHYKTVRRWWEAALSDEEPIGLAWDVLLGFLRLSTSARVFAKPLDSSQAIGQVEA
jgi:uncharacterized protein